MTIWEMLAHHSFRPNVDMVARQDGLITWAPDVPEQLKSTTLRYFRLAFSLVFSLICSNLSRLLSRLTFLHGRERNEDSLQRKIGDGLFVTIGQPIRKKKERFDGGGGGEDGGVGDDHNHDVDFDWPVSDLLDHSHSHDDVHHDGIGGVGGGDDGTGGVGGGACGGDDHGDHNDYGDDGGGDGGGDYDCSGPGDSFEGYA